MVMKSDHHEPKRPNGSTMTNDSQKRSSNNNKRKPTKRTDPRRHATRADSHYSKLTRTSTLGSTSMGRSRAGASQGTSPQDSGSVAEGFESLSRDAQQRVYGKRAPRRKGTGNGVALFFALAVIAALIGGGVLFWTHRSVSITVNGQAQKIRIGSTLDDLYQQAGVATNPGNFVTVGGNLIEPGTGYPYSASVDDQPLSREDTEAYRVRGGERVDFFDGGDRLEEYDVAYRDVQPRLVFTGDWGAVSYIKQWGKVGRQEIRHGKQSGETADGDWVEELRDCIVETRNVSPANGEKLVAITFDDGPAETYTQAYLDILAQYGAKATFFNLSSNEQTYPELARAVAESGNQICSHTNQHLQLTTLGPEDLLAEISSAHDTIQELTGVDTTIIRPPYGDFNQSCWLMTQGTVSASVIWNQDTLDWQQPGAESIVNAALTNIGPGSIILMHDGGGPRDQDFEALPLLIQALQADGYRLVTISELLASDPEIPAEIATGSARMPADAVWPTEIAEG